eukprot:scaffold106468_cov72-Phaeocystis_antarctica.AAC.1
MESPPPSSNCDSSFESAILYTPGRVNHSLNAQCGAGGGRWVAAGRRPGRPGRAGQAGGASAPSVLSGAKI